MALRDNPRISAARRKEVQQLAHALGYRPDPMLASLVAYRQRKRVKSIAATLAWINRWPDPKDLRRWREFDVYWQGAREMADRLGYRLEEFTTASGLTAARMNDILVARGIQGVLIPPHPRGVTWQDFAFDWSRFSVVRFGFSMVDPRVHMVGNDQMRSAELAVQRIAALGYRRIGYVSSTALDTTTDGNFRVGYLRGLELLGVRPHLKPLVIPVAPDISTKDYLEVVDAWLTRWKPDAIFTSEPGLSAVLKKLGRHVPGDIGLAATTVRDAGEIDAGLDQNPFEIGRVAVQTLIELVNCQEIGLPEFCRRVLVESRWVDGASLPPQKRR